MLLEDKTAILYGAGGGIGGGVARTFAREGANVFLAGRTRLTLEAVARDIIAAGGSTHVAQLDALGPNPEDLEPMAEETPGGLLPADEVRFARVTDDGAAAPWERSHA